MSSIASSSSSSRSSEESDRGLMEAWRDLPMFDGFYGDLLEFKSTDLRNHLVQKMIIAIKSIAENSSPQDLDDYCRPIEEYIFKSSTDHLDYFSKMDYKIRMIKEEFQSGREYPIWLFDMFKSNAMVKKGRSMKTFSKEWQKLITPEIRTHLESCLRLGLLYEHNGLRDTETWQTAKDVEDQIYEFADCRKSYYDLISMRVLDALSQTGKTFDEVAITKDAQDVPKYHCFKEKFVERRHHEIPADREWLRETILNFFHLFDCEVGKKALKAKNSSSRCHRSNCRKYQSIVIHWIQDCNDECDDESCKLFKFVVEQFFYCGKGFCVLCESVKKEVGKESFEYKIQQLHELISKYAKHALFDYIFEKSPFIPSLSGVPLTPGVPLTKTTKKWQRLLSGKVREHVVKRFAEKLAEKPKDLHTLFAEREEKKAFKNANSRNEYFKLTTKKFNSINKEFQQWPKWFLDSWSILFQPGPHTMKEHSSKAWQNGVTTAMRKSFKKMMEEAIYPPCDQGINRDHLEILKDEMEKIEKSCFEKANSREEFYKMIIKKCERMKEEKDKKVKELSPSLKKNEQLLREDVENFMEILEIPGSGDEEESDSDETDSEDTQGIKRKMESDDSWDEEEDQKPKQKKRIQKKPRYRDTDSSDDDYW